MITDEYTNKATFVIMSRLPLSSRWIQGNIDRETTQSTSLSSTPNPRHREEATEMARHNAALLYIIIIILFGLPCLKYNACLQPVLRLYSVNILVPILPQLINRG